MTAPTTVPHELTTCYAQVVLPVDFSPLSWHVLTLANRMSRAFGVPRRIVHVDTSSPWLDEGVNELVVEKGLAGGPVQVDVVASRTPADGILRVLGDDEGSLLVMSTHGHTGAAELATGSTAEALLQRWHGPMLLAGPRFRVSPVPFRRLVLCVDPDSTTTSPELDADVTAWATRFDIPIEVLAVVDPTPPSDFNRLLGQNQRLEEAVAALSSEDRVAKLVRLTGNRPGRDIARYVDSVDGTLVALPTHARPRSARVVLGSTAMAVLRHVTSPALVRRFPTR
jgi:nucleotide-binding universal stress UspA family protein